MHEYPLIDDATGTTRLTATWISPAGDKPDNYTFLARKAFSLAAIPERAILRVAADSRYVICLNGQRVGQGPAKGTHKRYFFDSYDIASGLRQGKNWLAVEVHCPVRSTYVAAPVTPALWVQLEDLVETDATWEVRPDPTHATAAPLYTAQAGFTECRDLRKEHPDWRIGGDGKKGWARAQILSKGTVLQGRQLSPRDIPALTNDALRPAAVVKTCCVAHVPAELDTDLEYAGLMHSEPHFEASFPRFEHIEALTQGGAATILPSLSQRGACCILDFQREVLGSVVLDLEAPEGTVVDVGYGDALVGGRLRIAPGNYRFADRYILRPGRQRIEHRLHDRGFRYLQIVFRRFAQSVTIHGVAVIHRVYPIRMEGNFECDQAFLNRLWTMCGATLQACCSDTFMDCPWREQALWMNDTLVEIPLFLAFSSDPALIRRTLRIGADSQLPDGLIPVVYPSARKTLFPSMPALWTLTLSEYYLYTGDKALVRELLPTMDKALGLYDTWREKDGLVADRKGMWNFIDWGYNADTAWPKGKTAVLNMLITAACKRAADLHQEAGDPVRALALRKLSQGTMAAIQRNFWAAKRARFTDGTLPYEGRHTVSQHPHGVGLFYELIARNQQRGALEALLDPETIQAELYFQHFNINALARAGHGTAALNIIRRLWGKMVRANSPTVWECESGADAFSGIGSLCHGFSCTPAIFMHQTLLGVRALKPGFGEFLLAPQSLGLLWARGSVPTPYGLIQAQWKALDDNRMRIEVVVPQNTTAVLEDGRRLTAGQHGVVIHTILGAQI